MKKYLLVLIFLSFLVPCAAVAEYKVPIVIEGVIGDFAERSRTYEVNGQYYQFQKDVAIETADGKILSFRHLRGGLHVQILGEQITGDDLIERTEYNKIIVIK
jgi:ribosome biogenesis SPOUT family RNA methylase Rps3